MNSLRLLPRRIFAFVARDFRLFWDNAYAVHHLTPERTRIANIDAACARHGHPNRAFIFGSTSKVTLSPPASGSGASPRRAHRMSRRGPPRATAPNRAAPMPICSRVYWPGSHYTHTGCFIETPFAAATTANRH